MSRCDIPYDWIHYTSQCLHEWQTLEAGVLALLAGLGSVYYLRKQISLSREIEENNRKRHFNAVRASFPLTLSSIVDFASLSFKELDQAKGNLKQGGKKALAAQISIPVITPDLVEQLRGFIEATDDQTAISLVSELLREVQVLSARMHSLADEKDMKNRVGIDFNIAEYKLQAARIAALADALFPFSRGSVESPPSSVSREAVVEVLSRWDAHLENDDSLSKRIELFVGNESPAWTVDD